MHFTMTRFLVLLLSLLIYCSFLAAHDNEIIYHDYDIEPDRNKYIWNPFPAFCGPNATSVRCGGVCPATCAYVTSKCSHHCGVPCICRPGYVFSEELLKCILHSDCPAGVQQQLVQMHRVFQ